MLPLERSLQPYKKESVLQTQCNASWNNTQSKAEPYNPPPGSKQNRAKPATLEKNGF